MIDLDGELAQEYLEECRKHLAAIHTDLLDIEKAGAQVDRRLVIRVFRAVCSVRGTGFPSPAERG
jgi:chemotaxis protein histidine kinase CheA